MSVRYNTELFLGIIDLLKIALYLLFNSCGHFKNQSIVSSRTPVKTWKISLWWCETFLDFFIESFPHWLSILICIDKVLINTLDILLSVHNIWRYTMNWRCCVCILSSFLILRKINLNLHIYTLFCWDSLSCLSGSFVFNSYINYRFVWHYETALLWNFSEGFWSCSSFDRRTITLSIWAPLCLLIKILLINKRVLEHLHVQLACITLWIRLLTLAICEQHIRWIMSFNLFKMLL